MDITLVDRSYRVVRQISLDEKILLRPIEHAAAPLGVPLWLTGEKLKAWEKEENDNPIDEDVDWEIYR